MFYYRYKAFTFVLTFMLYVSFHLSRKPISIVKVSNKEIPYLLILLVSNQEVHFYVSYK